MNIATPQDDPIAALVANAALPFETARAMPKSVYTSPDFLQAELDGIFAKEWFCAGRSDGLASPGDYLTLDLAGRPIAVIRGRDGKLRAMSNVCLHRMSTLLEGTGTTTSIVCPYHAWTYDLDGRLRGAPAMAQNMAFDRAAYCLPQIRCEEWLGWVMVSLNPDATPVAEHYAQVSEMIGDFAMEGYVQLFQETHIWDTNWKVLAENFMESYHLPVCHAATVGGLSKLEDMDCPPGLPSFNYHYILKDEGFKLALAHPANIRLKGDWRRTTILLALYPSLLITLTPGYFWYLSLHPEGAAQVRILYGGGLSPDFMDDPEARGLFGEIKELLDRVQDEDKGCTEKVYRGLCSDLAQPGHLSHLERPNYDFARYLAEKVAGQGA
ncbi:MAG: Rieske 2Fe-2S domain-containing protein [Rhodobacter sp.]|nr:Rieske 2Fe-2S domain-containing protein [Rhodobacter sp.]